MRTFRLAGLIAAIVLGSLAVAPASARDEKRELIGETLHSDLPLYTFDWRDLWPRNFHSEESFGCITRVSFGDWRFIPANGEEGHESWERYGNYGVFHCAAILRTADERAELDKAQWRYGFFVRLGKTRVGSRDWELWAIQKGMVPGSDYVLLARDSDDPGSIRKFRVLQRRCPPGLARSISFDVWITRYCPIDSRQELLALARNMMRLPPLGTIEYVGESAEPSEDDD